MARLVSDKKYGNINANKFKFDKIYKSILMQSLHLATFYGKIDAKKFVLTK